jgi:hypothetical protein
MVEFTVIAIFVLVPLFLAVQALGKFADVRSTMASAARYAAWERTVWSDDTTSTFSKHNAPNQKSTDAIKNEIRVRVLNGRESTSLQYKSTDKNLATYANGTDPLWRDTDGKAFITDPAEMKVAMQNTKPAKDFIGAAISLVNAISVPSITGTLAPPVPSDNLASATISLTKVAQTSEVYKRLWSKKEGLPADWDGLDFAATGGVLSNTWAANSSDGTKKMVVASVPTAVEVASKAIMLAWDPLVFPRLDLGKTAVDVVPADRLK